MNQVNFPTVRIDPDPSLSDTLPSWVYTAPEALAQEQHKIFFRTWHFAGATASVENSGDYITAGVLGQNILVMRGRDGQLRGFYNVCQHRAHELLEGRGNARVVTCPYHAWSYDLDGRLVRLGWRWSCHLGSVAPDRRGRSPRGTIGRTGGTA